MTVKEYTEKFHNKDIPPFESLSEDEKNAIQELTTGISVTFLCVKNSTTNSKQLNNFGWAKRQIIKAQTVLINVAKLLE